MQAAQRKAAAEAEARQRLDEERKVALRAQQLKVRQLGSRVQGWAQLPVLPAPQCLALPALWLEVRRPGSRV